MRLQRWIILCVTLHLFGACKNDTKKRDGYANYHVKIIEAETLLGQEKYGAALEVYDDIMTRYDFIFLRDYKIASQLALYTGQREKALNYLNRGVANGWELTELKKDKFLTMHLDASLWKNIERKYSYLHNKFLDRIDSTLRGKVQMMFTKDQELALNASLIEDGAEQEKFLLEKFSVHSERQLKDLVSILDDHGYPGELLIGNDLWMSTILSHHNSISEDYVKGDTLYASVKPKLLRSLDKGQISPYELALIEDWKQAVASGGTGPGYGYINSPSHSNLPEVNELREEIGLRSVELRNLLIDMEQKTGMSSYLPDWVDGKITIEGE